MCITLEKVEKIIGVELKSKEGLCFCGEQKYILADSHDGWFRFDDLSRVREIATRSITTDWIVLVDYSNIFFCRVEPELHKFFIEYSKIISLMQELQPILGYDTLQKMDEFLARAINNCLERSTK